MANYTLHALAPQITNTLALVPDTKAARGKLVTANTPPVPVPAVMIGKMALVNKKIGIILLVKLEHCFIVTTLVQIRWKQTRCCSVW